MEESKLFFGAWHPVIERLPDKDGTYFVTTMGELTTFKNDGQWMVGTYGAVGFMPYTVEGGWWYTNPFTQVIAWSELPQPYIGKEMEKPDEIQNPTRV